MNKKAQVSTNKILTAGIIIIAALTIQAVSSARNRDVNFCRRAFYYLVKGRNFAQTMVDWDKLEAVGVDVGKTYLSLPSDTDRKMYRKNFINRFAVGFLQAEGDYKSFVNWRVYQKDDRSVTVAVDYKKTEDTLLFVVPRKGRKKVQIIKWKKQGDIVK